MNYEYVPALALSKGSEHLIATGLTLGSKACSEGVIN